MRTVRQSGGYGLRRVLLPVLLLFGATCAAQSIDPVNGRYALNEDGSMPAWVVPVLRLVSSTHVEPTTGLVLSDSGLVLVPMGFASEGDEVIVLDGGTDIVRNGRPAHLKDYFPAEGLQILSVPGLRRQAAPFATESLTDGARVELTAFPPAERIAEGDAPLHTAATVVVFRANGAPAVSGETPLPNVTGPLLDECGNVAAYSLAHDVQTISSHPGTRYKWCETLLAILTRLGVTPAPTACRSEAADTVEPAQEEIQPVPEAEAPAPNEPEVTEDANAPASDTADEPPEDAVEEPAPEQEVLDLDRLPPIETDLSPLPEPEPRTAWPWLLLGLALLGAGVWLHWRRRRSAVSESNDSGSGEHTAPAMDTSDERPAPAPELDRRLVLRGVLADGTPLDARCAVSSRAVNVVVGRGSAADLVLPSAAISRQHARLNGTPDALTVADLGSSNGTSVNGVPCLEGEILYLEADDVLVLGDAQLSVAFETPEEADG